MFRLFRRRRFISDFPRTWLRVGDNTFSLFHTDDSYSEHTFAFWKYRSCTRQQLQEFCLSQLNVFWITHKMVTRRGSVYYKLSIYHSLDHHDSTQSYFIVSDEDYTYFRDQAQDCYYRNQEFEGLLVRRVTGRSSTAKLCWKKYGF